MSKPPDADPAEIPKRSPALLFCPFCGEGYEDRDECPEHDLTLLPVDAPSSTAGRTLEAVSFFADPRLGRGSVLLGAVLVLGGFLAPFVVSGELTASALEIAIDGAGNLWLTPGAAIGLLWILWHRRRRDTMRAARAAAFGLAAMGSLPLLYTSWRIGVMASAAAVDLSWLWGLWLMASGLVLAALGSRGLGGGHLGA